MFEVIGIVVAIWIGFVIIKSVIGGGIKGTLLRAAHAAIEQGIPRDFAMTSINNSEQLIRARKALAKENPKIGTMDIYLQYAATIIASYRLGKANDMLKRDENRVPISHVRPASDQDIIQMILQVAQSSSLKINFPNFRYGELGDFVSRSEVGVEYFPGYSGLRFWIDIGEYSYSVSATNLDPAAEDAGSVSIWAKQDGPAERLNVTSS